MTDCRGQSKGCWRRQHGQAAKPCCCASQQKEDYARICLERKMKAGVHCPWRSSGEIVHKNVGQGKSQSQHFPFYELGAQQDLSLRQQHLAPAGRRDNARGSMFDSSQTRAPPGKQRPEHRVIGALIFHRCFAACHTQEGWDHISALLQATMVSPASVTSDH